MRIRPAETADLPEIQAIYAYHVLHGTGSFEEEPASVEAMGERWQAVVRQGWSWLVAASGTGFDFYDFLLGVSDTSSVQYSNHPEKYFRTNWYDVYMTDDWRINKQFQMMKFDGQRWVLFGPILTDEFKTN